MNDNKTLKEQSTKLLLSHTLSIGDNNLSPLEQMILKEVLLNNKTFKELTEVLKLTTFRQRQIFDSAINRLNKIIASSSEKLNNYASLEKELSKTKEKLEVLQNSTDKKNKLSPELKKLLDIPINKIGFSSRVLNICIKANIDTIADLVHYSRREMSMLRDMGQKSLDEMEAYLNSKGLSWKMRF